MLSILVMRQAYFMLAKRMNDLDTIEKLMMAAKAVGYGEIPPYEHHECFTTGAFDLIATNGTDRGRNFRILEAIVHQYRLVRADSRFLSGYLYLLMQLARATDTTEMPSGMKIILEENPTATKELWEWYRFK